MERYEKIKGRWDEIFGKEGLQIPKEKESGNQAFDQGLNWLTEKGSHVIDFGCGNGTMLFLCSLYGTSDHIGIDLSSAAIAKARERGGQLPNCRFSFICGGVETLGEPDIFILTDGGL